MVVTVLLLPFQERLLLTQEAVAVPVQITLLEELVGQVAVEMVNRMMVTMQLLVLITQAAVEAVLSN
jgi:hypothetical protein